MSANNINNTRIKTRNKGKNKKRKSPNSGASSDKRQRLSSDASEIIESEEPEALPENYGGETKESDSDRRGREKKEREQKKREEAAERKRQRLAKTAAGKSKSCLANIGGKRVEKNGIITFEGGETFGPYSKQEAEDNTGIPKGTIKNNITKKGQSSGKKGVFENKQLMFINAPDDTSDRVHCGHCNKHYGTEGCMIRHVRAKHPGMLPPAAERIKMPEEYKRFTPSITPEQYYFIVERIRNNINHDVKRCDLAPTLMALVDGVDELPEPLPSVNIGGAGEKYHLDEQQILDSIANNESLTIVGGIHVLRNELGKSFDYRTCRTHGYI